MSWKQALAKVAHTNMIRRERGSDVWSVLNRHLPERKYVPVSVRRGTKTLLSSILLKEGCYVASGDVEKVCSALKTWRPRHYGNSSVEKSGRSLRVVCG